MDLWNTIPFELRSSVSIDAFKRRLKMYLFKLAFLTFSIFKININLSFNKAFFNFGVFLSIFPSSL